MIPRDGPLREKGNRPFSNKNNDEGPIIKDEEMPAS
jgi:hypothetical protein